MSSASRRLARERRTVLAMIRIYCRDHHGSRGKLCVECDALWNYCQCRLDKCPFGEEKPTCVNCPIHCYQPAPREQIKTVMRYAGPRMMWRHPILAIGHLLDGRREVSAEKARRGEK
ncbi:MAG: nitrous oxide-stimulated promoter family protein [Verrucomicrobia bacterium]|nr:nitrous oxide-stimulated promoter family protein [Verrucomicrobiota bacterium]